MIDETRAGRFVHCSMCGRELRSLHDRIKGDNDLIACEFCYQNFLFPNAEFNWTELFD
jgi:hypothetical protein